MRLDADSRTAAYAACALVFSAGLAAVGCSRDPAPAAPPEAVSDAASRKGATALGDTTADFTAAAQTAFSADGTYEVTWEPIGGGIPDAEPFSIAVGVSRTDGRPLAASVRVLADAEMPHHGHGMNLRPGVTRRNADAYFVVDSMLFHMTGRWVLAVDVEEDGVMERTQWYVDIE